MQNFNAQWVTRNSNPVNYDAGKKWGKNKVLDS